MSQRRAAITSDRGQASVELALLLPIVVLLLLAVLQVGLVARDVVLVTHASREAARAAALDGAPAAARRAAAAAGRLGEHLVQPPLYGEWSERWGRQAVDLLVRTAGDFDGVACGSDQIARGVCDRLRELGRSVPDDVAVTGFDDWDVMALASRPPLTTIDLRLEELGRLAGRALLDLIAGRRPAQDELVLSPTLIIRESTIGG